MIIMYFTESHIVSQQKKALHWSTVYSLKEGEEACGDGYLVLEQDHKILIAVVDGLGHGTQAAQASKKAVELLKRYSNYSLINLVKNCHDNLHDTRGVVLSVASIDVRENILAWIGIGNVEVTLIYKGDMNLPQIERLMLRSGIVGYKLPFLQVSMIPIAAGDIIIFATDGVEGDYVADIDYKDCPHDIVEMISSTYFNTMDDSLVLAAQYQGAKGL